MKRPSPSMVVSLIALVFSMTGTGLAASRYVISSTSQIKPSVLHKLEKPALAATPAQPGPQGERGPEGKAGATGLTGSQGPGGESVRGPKGEPGERGEVGETGGLFLRVTQHESAPYEIAPGEHRTEGLEVRCPEGQVPVSGAYEVSEPTVRVYSSRPASNTGWEVSAINEGGTEQSVVVKVVCSE